MKKAIASPLFDTDLVQGNINRVKDLRTEGHAFADEECTQVLSSKEFFECKFTNVTFTEKSAGCLFADVIFDHCDLSNCDFSESVFRRVIFRSCRMIGTELIKASFQDTVINGCQCGYGNFAGSTWKYAQLQEDRFADASFSSCRFNNLEVMQCDFSRAEFFETSLNGLDLSDSRIDGFIIGPQSLKGVTMNREQALACTALLGIKVKD